jgi:hypothetical protein
MTHVVRSSIAPTNALARPIPNADFTNWKRSCCLWGGFHGVICLAVTLAGGRAGSAQKRCTELRSDSTQIFNSGLSVPIGLREVSEEGLEAGW